MLQTSRTNSNSTKEDALAFIKSQAQGTAEAGKADALAFIKAQQARQEKVQSKIQTAAPQKMTLPDLLQTTVMQNTVGPRNTIHASGQLALPVTKTKEQEDLEAIQRRVDHLHDVMGGDDPREARRAEQELKALQPIYTRILTANQRASGIVPTGVTEDQVRAASTALDQAKGNALNASLRLGSALTAQGGNPYSAQNPELQAWVERAKEESSAAYTAEQEAAARFNKLAGDLQYQKYAALSGRDDFLLRSAGNAETANQAAASTDPADIAYARIYGRKNNTAKPDNLSGDIYRYVNDEEASRFFYLWNTEGKKAAMDYLGAIKYQIDERLAREQEQRLQKLTETDAGAAYASAASVLLNQGSIVGVVDLTMQNIRRMLGDNRPIDYNTQAQAIGKAAQQIRANVSENLEGNTKTQLFGITNLAAFLYQTGMSMADSSLQLVLNRFGVPEPVTLALMSGGAAQQAVYDAKERGASDGQALLAGYAAGIAEYAFEKISLDNLVGSIEAKAGETIGEKLTEKWTSNLAKKVGAGIINAGKQGLVEGSEEAFTTLANTVTDLMVNGDKSELLKDIDEMGTGPALRKWITGLALDAMGGIISGVGMGIGGNVIRYAGGVAEDAASAVRATAAKESGQAQAETPAEPEMRAAPPTPPESNPLAKALDKLRSGEQLTKNDARRIIEDEASMQTLRDAGLARDIRPGGDGREQIRQAVESYARLNTNLLTQAQAQGNLETNTEEVVSNGRTVETSDRATAETAGEQQPQTSFRERARAAAETQRSREILDREERRSGLGRFLAEYRANRAQRSAESQFDEQNRRANSLRNQAEARNLTFTSAAEQGVPGGTEDQTFQVMPADMLDRNMRTAQQEAAKNGIDLRFMIGQGRVNDSSGDYNFRGWISADGKRMLIQADHSKLTWQQILDHEELHKLIKSAPGYREAVEDALLSDARLQPYLSSIVDRYAEAYNSLGVTDENEIIEELLADYRAGFDMLDIARGRAGDVRTKATARKDIRAVEKRVQNAGATGTQRTGKASIRLSREYASDGSKLSPQQQEYFKDSKVRDDQGRLQVVYHGTPRGGFTEFAVSDDIGYFFTDSYTMAGTYSGGGDTYAPERIKTWEQLEQIAKENDIPIERAADNSGWVLDSEPYADNELEYAADQINSRLYDGDRMRYEAYLNIKSPLIIDGHGQNWDNISGAPNNHVIETVYTDDDTINLKVMEKGTYDTVIDTEVSDFDGVLAALQGLYGDGEAADTLTGEIQSAMEEMGHYDNYDVSVDEDGYFAYGQSTRDWVREAQEMGYDGVIFYNIQDSGSYGYGTESGNVYVAFDSNQIKSTRNTEPTKNGDIRFSRELDRDYLAAVESGDMEKAQRMVDEAAEAGGWTIHAYHGTGRADRVGTVFRADRATSGPMAFFTDDKSVADNYAKSKADTSLAYDTNYDSYEEQFRVLTPKGANHPLDMKLASAWGYVPFEDRKAIREKAEQLRFDWYGEDDTAFILDPENKEANGSFQWQLKESKGNVFRALIEQWLNSANLFDKEARFLDVLRMVGATDALKRVGLDVQYKDPNYREEKTYDVYLKMTRPFNTAKVNSRFIENLEKWYDKQPYGKYDRESVGADLWDKNSVTVEDFAERLRNDLEDNTTHAWTSIPDAVTDYLKHLKYDGIVDKGGKYSGLQHTVYIPFYSEQIKDSAAVTYDDQGNVIPLSERFNPEDQDIRYSREIDPQEIAKAEYLTEQRRSGRTGGRGRKKVSRVRTHAFELGGLYNEVEAHMAETQPGEFTYDVEHEKDSMANALKRLKKDFTGESESLPDKRDWTGEDLDTAMGILYQYRQVGRDTGDYSKFHEWSHIIQEKGTRAGEFIHGFAKYSRTATERARKATEDLREKAGKLTPAEQKRVQGHVDELLGAIDEAADEAAQDAVEAAKGEKQTGLKLPTADEAPTKQIKQLKRRVQQLRSEKTELQQELKNAQKQNARANSANQFLKDKLAEKDRQLKEAEQALKRAQEQVDNLGRRLGDVADELDREKTRRKDAESIIRQIYGIFSEKDHGPKVEDWLSLSGEELANRIASRMANQGRGNSQRTTMQTIIGDLYQFAQEHVQQGNRVSNPRTAVERISDYMNNREAYAKAWNEAKQVLREMYAGDQNKLDALNAFLNSTLSYNAGATDAVMYRAILESADALGISKKDILNRAAIGPAVTVGLIEDIADEFIRRVGTDDGTLRDTVYKHINRLVVEEGPEKLDARLGRMENEASKALDIKLQDLLRESRRTKADAANAIAQYLINDLGISGTDAAIAANHIAGHYMDRLAQKANQTLQRMFEARGEKLKPKQRDKLMDLIRLGGLTNANVEDAVVDALGLGKLSRARQREITTTMAQMADLYDAIEDNDLEALRSLIRQQAAVRNTKLDRLAEKVLSGETDVEYLRSLALAQLDLIAADYRARTAGEKVSTAQVISHLLNARTAMRNLTSNQLFDLVDSLANNVGLLPDMIMGQITGQRSVGLNKSWASQQKRQGAIKGAGRNLLEIALDAAPNDRNQSKYGTGGRRTFSMANSGTAGKLLSKMEQVLGYELNTTDEFHKGSVFGETIESLARWVDAGYMTMEEAEEFATEMALYRSFQDDTIVGSILGGLKDVMNIVGTGKTNGKTIKGKPVHDWGLGDLMVKYTQVPGALVHRAIEYSPVGYLKAIYNIAQLANAKHKGESTIKQQRKAALALGRATTGTGLITLFALLAKAGLLRRKDDEKDKNAAALRQSQGFNGTQLNVSALGRMLSGGSLDVQDGDVLADIGFLEPLDSLMTIAALAANDPEIKAMDLYDMFRNPKTAGKMGEKSLQGIWLALEDTSAMQTLSNIYSTVRYHDEANDLPLYMQIPMEIAASSVSGFIPAPIRQIAQATDTVYRDQYRSQNLLDQTAAKVANAIPGVRQQLAPKLTPLGEPRKYQAPVPNALNAMLNPGNVNVYQPDEVTDELLRLYDATGNGSILPERNAPYKVTLNKESYTLTPDERTAYQRTRGQAEAQMVREVSSTDWYSGLDADAQADVLEWCKKFTNYVAQKSFSESRGIEYSNTSYEDEYQALISGTEPAQIARDALSKTIDLAEAGFSADERSSLTGKDREEKLDFITNKDATDEEKLKALGTVLGTSMTTKEGNPTQWANVNTAVKDGLSVDKAVELLQNDTLDDYMKWRTSEAKKTGIGSDTYIHYRVDTGKMNADKDAKGKTISGSKKEKVVKYINSLKLTMTQKDALYRDAGYAESELENTPWHKRGGGTGVGRTYAPANLSGLRLPTVENARHMDSGLRLPTVESTTSRPSNGLQLPTA